MVALEVCVDNAAGLDAAVSGGADRVELCSALALGGLTPGPGLLTRAAECGVPVFMMIRPRPGGFLWSGEEVDDMIAEIRAARAHGLAGVVVGASLPGGALDIDTLARLRDAARDLSVTLHRAFDLVPDWSAALEQAVTLGIDRILTSGGAATALEGLDRLADVNRAASGRIGILPGSGITPENVVALVGRLGVAEVHSSCAGAIEEEPGAVALGFAPPQRKETDPHRVARMKAVLRALA